MKKLITLIMIAVIVLLASTNVSYGDSVSANGLGDDTAILIKDNTIKDNSFEVYQGDVYEDGAEVGTTNNTVNGGDTNMETNIDNTTIIPAPILPVPGFVNPNERTPYDESWTSNSFDLSKTDFTIAELRRVANPSRFLFLGWCEWDKSFKIEMACWAKSKPQSSVRVYTGDVTVNGFTKMGEAHARAVELHKSEKQVAAALCIYAAKQGAKVVVIRTFSNPVTKADSAVLGGAGASVTGSGDIVNSAGGFGWTTAEKVYRSYVVAELYN